MYGDSEDTYGLDQNKIQESIMCIVFIHASGWKITVDEEDPPFYKDLTFNRKANKTHILDIPYDRKQFLLQSVQEAQDISKNILQKVQSEIHGQSTVKGITFVADDLGGLILKQALLLADRDDKYSNVTISSSTLVFFGSPNRAIDSNHCRSLMLRLICPWEENASPEEVEKIVTQAAGLLLSTLRSFRAIENRYRIINIHQNNILPDGENLVVEPWAARSEIANEVLIARETSHQKLSHFQEDSIWENFLNLLKESGEGYEMGWLPRTYLDLYKAASGNQHLQVSNNADWAQMERQRSPNKDLINCLRGSQKLRDWKAAASPNVLLLQSATPLEIGDINLLLDAGREKSMANSAKILSASFPRRVADIENRFLYRSLLSCIKELGKYTDDRMVMPDIFDHRVTSLWTERQIWGLFRTILGAWKGDKIIFIIAAAERCPSHERWFIDELVAFADGNERQLQIIISQKDEHPQYSKSIYSIELHHIDVDEALGQLKYGEDILNAFLRRQPRFEFMRQELLNKINSAPLNSYAGLHLMLRYLESASILSTELSMRKEIEQFSALHLSNVVEFLLDKIPEPKRNWASNVLTWITCTRELLTIESLRPALAIEEVKNKWLEAWNRNISCDLANDLEQGFPLLLDLEGGYVRFANDELYRYFAKPNSSHWDSLGHESEWTLCRKCIFYLSTENVITQSRSYSEDNPASELLGDYHDIWHDFLTYANRFWPVHYKAAAKNNCADHDLVLEFLRNVNAVKAWSELYWELEEPIFKQQRGLSSLDPLHIAIRFGFVEIAEILIEGTESRNKDDFMTNMHCAAQNGHEGILQKLLDKFKPEFSIIYAILRDTLSIGSEAVLQTLLQYVDIKASPPEVIRTLLHLAAENGWSEIINRIFGTLTANLDDDIYTNSETVSLLHRAANHGYTDIFKFLYSKRTVTAPVVNNSKISLYSPLHLAAMRGHIDIVHQLSDSEITLTMRGPKLQTALHLAAKNGFSQIVKVLIQNLQHCALPPLIDIEGSTPHAKYSTGEEESTLHDADTIDKQRLIPHFADVIDDEGSTPLHLACQGGFRKTTLELIEVSNRDIDIKDHKSNTILHAAAQGGNLTIIQNILNSYRHLIAEENELGDTPLRVALREKHEAIAVFIIRGDLDSLANSEEVEHVESKVLGSLVTHRSNDGNSALTLAMQNDLREAMKAILRHEHMVKLINGSPLDEKKLQNTATDDDSLTRDLHIAATKGYSNIVSGILLRRYDTDRGMTTTQSKNELEQALTLASGSGHLDVVRELLRHTQDVPIQLQSSLIAAVSNNHVDIVKCFSTIALSDTPNLFSAAKDQFLSAASDGHVDMACILLNNNISVDHQDEYQNTALMLAAYNDQPDVVQLLLLRKANTELRDDSQSTAISDAAAQGSVGCVKLLIKAGAKINVRNEFGETPIARAVINEYIDVVKILLQADANVEIQDQFGNDALSKATACDNMEILKVILDVVKPSKECLQQALIRSTWLVAKEAVRILEEYGAMLEPEMLEPEMWPLHKAIREGKTYMVEYYLKHGTAKRLLVNGEMGTPLQQALFYKRFDIVDILLDYGVDVNQEGGPFHTALHIAAFKDNTQGASIVRKLLEAGAKVEIEGGLWKTVLHAAVSHSSHSSYSLTIARLLLYKKGDLKDVEDEQLRLPLHLAARTNNVELVELVAPSRTEKWPEIKDCLGRSPIHFAAMGGALNVVRHMEKKYLIDFKNCDLRRFRDIDGWTPLHWACRGGDKATVEFFMQMSGGDYDIQTHEEWTPRHIAIYHGNANLLPSADEPSSSEEGKYDGSTICSSCICDIYGTIWKCTVCDDYDLCFKCNLNAEVIHHHPLYRTD